jgi:lactoylglutathione lyase
VSAFREAFPILAVRDPASAGAFYTETFGFEVKYRFPPEGEPDFLFLSLPPLGIGLTRRRPGEPEHALCIYTDDVDAAAASLRAAGATEISAPADQPWGERMTQFEDGDGHRLVVLSSAGGGQ